MSKMLVVCLGCLTLVIAQAGQACAADQATIDQVVNIAKVGCLLGNEFTFDAKSNGELTFTKMKPGAEAAVHTNIKNEPGAPGIVDQQLKVVATQQIRDCMKPYVQKLAELILGQASGNQITSVDATSALDLGDCPSTASSLWDEYPNRTYRCNCPVMTESELQQRVVGTSVYLLSSSLCTAAVHAGALKRDQPGSILMRLVSAPPVFRSTAQNGVHSSYETEQVKYGMVIAEVK